MEEILTLQKLWEGYDPEAEELDVTVLNTVEKDGIVTKRVYFTGRELDGCKTRVFGVVCNKATRSSRHAVLVVDDYDKPIDEKVLVDLAERGFIAMAIDYVGARDTGLHTLYPEPLAYCNASANQDIYNIVTTARDIKVYEYALNSRRAVSYLLACENANGVSVMGAKKGVDVASIVLGVDERVTNGVLAFGRIWRNYPELVVKDGDNIAKKQAEYDYKSQSWMMGLAPQTYMLQIKVPLYVIISSNSYYTNVHNANKSFSRVNCVSKLLILPNSLDFVPTKYANGVTKWLKGHYESESAEIVACHDDGDYRLKVVTQAPLSKVTLYYTKNDVGRAKHWVKSDLKKGSDGAYYGELALSESNCKILAFAQIDGDVPTSTKLFEDVATPLNLKKSSNIIFIADGSQTLPMDSLTGEWWNVPLEPKLTKGPMDISGALGNGFVTFAINDVSIKYKRSFTIGFDVFSECKQTVTVTTICKFGETNERYQLSATVFGGRWERLTFEKDLFKRVADGKLLSDKDKVDIFIISADKEIVINNMLLV